MSSDEIFQAAVLAIACCFFLFVTWACWHDELRAGRALLVAWRDSTARSLERRLAGRTAPADFDLLDADIAAHLVEATNSGIRVREFNPYSPRRIRLLDSDLASTALCRATMRAHWQPRSEPHQMDWPRHTRLQLAALNAWAGVGEQR